MGSYKYCFRVHGCKALLVLLIAAILAACFKIEDTPATGTLKVAVLPDQDAALLRHKYRPLLDHIGEETGMATELLIPDSYDQLLQWFAEKKIHMAKFGGATYVMAHKQNHAVPFVIRDVDGNFRSVALVHKTNSAKSLRDVKGMSLAFGARLSTSGHIMPRHFLQMRNINPEKHFSNVEHSNAHDKTAEWVRDGKVEVGIANSGVVDEMFQDGRLTKDKVKVIWVSPPFSDYVWTVQPDMNKNIKMKIRDVFLHLNYEDEHKNLLKNLGANYFIPVGHDDFKRLELAVMGAAKQEATK